MEKSHARCKCQVFVCVNDRTDGRKACAHNNSGQIRQKLKIESRNRWAKDLVRISQTGCLGACELGPNVMIYPQNIWFSKVSIEDVDQIFDEIARFIEPNK